MNIITRLNKQESHAKYAIALILVLLCIQLNLQDQLWIATSGEILFWSSDAWGVDASQHFLDPYSFTHFLHGFMFCAIIFIIFPKLNKQWRFSLAVLFEACWEIIENTDYLVNKYRTTTASKDYLGDTILNSYGDILSCSIGFWVAHSLGWKKSLLVFIVIELVLTYWFRDSLLLNILNLTFPIDSIKEWQLHHG